MKLNSYKAAMENRDVIVQLRKRTQNLKVNKSLKIFANLTKTFFMTRQGCEVTMCDSHKI